MARKKVAKNEAGDFTVEEILRSANDKFGENALTLIGKGTVMDIPVISTGSLAIDKALGVGGLPYGRIVEIYGPESSGKTTLCCNTIANCQAEGGIAAFIDTEHALDPQYAETIGVDIDKLLLSQPDSGEDALEQCEFLVRTGSVDMIVIDSVSNLVPRAELEGQMGDAHVGLQARLMSQALRKLTGIIRKYNVLVIFTNQIRMKIGVMFGSPETTSGGRALKFYASIRMDIRRKATIKNGSAQDAEAIGNEIKVKIVKNKVAPPFKIAETRIMFDGLGLCLEFDVLMYAIREGYIIKKGGWYEYDGLNIAQGADNAVKYLQENTQLCQDLYEAILNPEDEEEEEEEKEVSVKEQIKTLRVEKKLHKKGTDEYKSILKQIKELQQDG